MYNYRLFEFLELPHHEFVDYVNTLRHLRDRDTLKLSFLKIKAREIRSMTFEDVSILKKSIGTDIVRAFQTVYGFEVVFKPKRRRSDLTRSSLFIPLPRWLISRLKITNFFPCFNHIRTHLEQLAREEENISDLQKHNPDLKAAGSEKMLKFGVMNVLRPIAQSYGLMPEDVARWSYKRVILEVYMDTTQGRIRDDYHDILEKKSK